MISGLFRRQLIAGVGPVKEKTMQPNAIVFSFMLVRTIECSRTLKISKGGDVFCLMADEE
jgi:hypothetical protein